MKDTNISQRLPIRRTKIKWMVLILVLMLVFALLFFAEELIRSFTVGNTIVESESAYRDGSFAGYRYGEEANLTLPKYEDFANANAISFMFLDNPYGETIFRNRATMYFVGVTYEKEVYQQQKDNVLANTLSNSRDFGHGFLGPAVNTENVGVLKAEKTASDDYELFFAVCSDETNSIVFCLAYDDREIMNFRTLYTSTFFTRTDFWLTYFPENE